MPANPPRMIVHPSFHSVDRAGAQICAIVMHGTAGTNSLDYLTSNPKGVSTHYLLPRSGEVVYRMVDEARGANHAGAPSSSFSLNGKTYKAGAVNRATIGVELESMQTGRDDYTDAQLLTMGWLINAIRSRHGSIPLLRHQDLDPTRRRDPVNLSHDQMEKWANAAVLVYDPPLLTTPRPHRVIGLPVYQRADHTGALWGHLKADERVVIDDMSNGHLADGRGFVDLSGLEETRGAV